MGGPRNRQKVAPGEIEEWEDRERARLAAELHRRGIRLEDVAPQELMRIRERWGFGEAEFDVDRLTGTEAREIIHRLEREAGGVDSHPPGAQAFGLIHAG